ncbi:MAG: PAS domain S-box protein [Anaerolineae bacterium]|nr:PAS domain S-box protein [Anaerolineae bacterium]
MPAQNAPLQQSLFRYLLALVVWGVTLAIWLSLRPAINLVPTMLFLLCAVGVSWYLGFGPAIMVSLLSTVVINYYQLQPQNAFAVDIIGIVQSLIIFFTGFIVSYIQTTLRRREIIAQQEREQLRVTLRSIGEGVITVDSNARVLTMNPTAELLTGWLQEDARGKTAETVFNIISELDRQPALNPLTQAIHEKRPVGLANHTILIQKNGKEISIDDGAAPIVSARGEVTGAILVFRDVSERRRSEIALELSEIRFRQIANSAPVLIWIAGTDTYRHFFNKAWLEFTGRTLEQEVNRGWLQGVHPQDRQRCLDTYQQSFAARQPYQLEYRLCRHDGVYRWVLDNGVPQYDRDGEFTGFIGSCIDIDERKRFTSGQQYLAEAAKLLSTSLDYEVTLQHVADLTVRELADWCAVDLTAQEAQQQDTDGAAAILFPRRLAVAHTDPEKVALAQELYQRYPPTPSTDDAAPAIQLLREGKPFIIPEVTDEMLKAGARDEEHLEILRNLQMRSAIVVPLIARGRLLGAISLIAAESNRRYDEADAALASKLAEQAALAIDNTLLYREAQTARQRAELAVRRLSRLQTIIDLLSRTETSAEREAIDVILNEGRQACGAFAASVVRLSADGTQLQLVESVGYAQETMSNWHVFPIDMPSPAADSIKSGQPLWLESPESLFAQYPNMNTAAREGKAWAAIPLISEGRITGALLLSFAEPRKFDLDEQIFMVTLALKSAQALERSRLYRQEQAAVAQLQLEREQAELLAEATQLAATPPSLPRQLNHVARLLIPRFADWADIHVLDDDAVSQVAVSARRLETMLLLQQMLRTYPSEENRPNLAKVMRTGEPIFYEQFTEEHLAGVARGNQEHADLLRKIGTTSVAIVPLRVREQQLGAITLAYTDSGRRYTAESMQFLQELANRAALTFDNARLYQSSQRQRGRLQVTLSSIGDAVIATDADGHINFMNEVAQSLTGWLYEEAAGRNLNDVFNIVNEYTRRPADNPVTKVLNEGVVVGLANHTILISRTGIEVPIDDSAAPIRDENGQIIGVVLIFRDISERRQTEARVASTLERTRDLSDICIQIGLAQTPTEILRALLSSRYIPGINQAAIIVFNQLWGEMMPESYEVRAVLNPDAGLPGLGEKGVLKNSLFAQICSTERPVLLENLYKDERITDDLRSRFSDLDVGSVYLLPLLSGRDCFGMLILYRAVTQGWDADDHQHLQILVTQLSAAMNNLQLLTAESRARREAERADQVKLQFLAMISHELRTPLASIKGFTTSLLATDVQWDEKSQHEFLSIINDESDRLTGLIEQLLDLSRLQAGSLGIQPQPIPLSQIVGTAMPQLSALTEMHPLVVEIAQNLPLVFADRDRIAQVLVNLVDNAVKYSPEDTPIVITAQAQDRFMCLTVDDQGMGIPPEERNNAFEAFRQIESQASPKAKGAGLGLAICKGLVEAHGGQIWIEDKPTAGLRISFTIPLLGR